jgi:hypothetical protein
MINLDSVIYHYRPNVGIMLPHKHLWWSRWSRPQGHVDPDAKTLVHQLECHKRQHHVVLVHIRSVSDPVEIAEVDQFGSDPEFPLHNGVQCWSSPCSYIALRGATWEGELEREGEAHKRGELQAPRIVCSPPPLGSLYIREKGGTLTPPPSKVGLKRRGHIGQGLALGGNPLGPYSAHPQALGTPTHLIQ